MCTMKPVYLLLLMMITFFGAEARDPSMLREGAQVTQQGKGVKLGRRFDLKKNGGAAALLAQLDRDFPGKVDRIMQTSRFTEGRAQLAKELDADGDMGLDLDNEAIMFQCTALAVGPNRVASSAGPSLAQADITNTVQPQDADPLASQAFNLASRPTAVKKIYLNFLGGTVTGTAWNSASLPNITIPPYDTEGNGGSTGFSTQELSNIVAIWRAVAEDYAPFNVDVTTIRPASLIGSSHVMIGGDGSWYGSAGGVAFVNIMSATDTYYQPAFIFPGQLGNGYTKYVWEATSHEVGHNMGLRHDGQINADGTTTAYYSGLNGWAPIMGIGYYQSLTQWSKGEYASANQLQDDVAVISSAVGWAPSTAGSSAATATPLSFTISAGTATGKATAVVPQTGVASFFSFDAGSPGTATITVQVVRADSISGKTRSNLDVQLTLYSASNAVVASANPAGMTDGNGLGLTTSAALPAAGRYYIAIAGAGSGDPLTGGYSSYGSIGEYALTATYPAPAAVPSPSPAPLPSPSPAPRPSPSPAPVMPSPSPPPTTLLTMTPTVSVTSSTSGRGSKATYSCTATVRVTTSTGALVSSPVVGFTWSSVVGTGGYPYSSTATPSTGSMTISTANPLYSYSRGCTFTLTSVQRTGYVVAPTVALPMQASATW